MALQQLASEHIVPQLTILEKSRSGGCFTPEEVKVKEENTTGKGLSRQKSLKKGFEKRRKSDHMEGNLATQQALLSNSSYNLFAS